LGPKKNSGKRPSLYLRIREGGQTAGNRGRGTSFPQQKRKQRKKQPGPGDQKKGW